MQRKYIKPSCEIVVLNLSSVCVADYPYDDFGLHASATVNQEDAEAKQNTFINSNEDLPSYNAWDTWDD